MNVTHPGPGTDPSARRRGRLRLIGAAILVLGLGGAGLTYWLQTRGPDVSDDPSMLGFHRAQQRQMGQLYGKMGLLIDDWVEDLKQPGTQATLIGGAAILIAGGCFYFARRPDDAGGGAGSTDLPHG